MARCPAHEDRSPSLRITALESDRTLIHCFAGCGASDVLNALRLDYSVLYPDDHFQPHHRFKKNNEKSLDEIKMMICRDDRAKGRRLTSSEKQEELQAYLRARGKRDG